MAKPKTARQRAASKRNLEKARRKRRKGNGLRFFGRGRQVESSKLVVRTPKRKTKVIEAGKHKGTAASGTARI